MKEAIKKGFFLGLGAASLTKSKVETTINNIVKKGKITKSEGKQLAKTILKEPNKARKKLENLIVKEVKKQIKKAKPKIKESAKVLEEEGKKVAKNIMKELK